MKSHYIGLILMSFLAFSCKETPKPEIKETETIKEVAPTFQNKGHELVYQMVQKVGTYNDLLEKKDVIYTYTYATPDGKKDVTQEKYIFDGELSYGNYLQHERTFPDLEGTFEQGYDGKEYWLKHDGKFIEDEARLKRVAFNRPTNFYWFAMFQKLLDPGLTYETLEEQQIDEQLYDVVKVGFNSDKPTDIYQVYINKKTGLVDQFLFTVADFNVIETPFLMQVEYEDIDGILIPNKRKYKMSTWDAAVSDKPWILVNWTDIKFNNKLSPSDFNKS